MKLDTTNSNGLWLLSIPLLLLFLPLLSFAGTSVGCDDTFVTLNSGKLVIDVMASGSADDTDNIQCALDAAINAGIPVVQLGVGSFNFSQINAENFTGSFQGTTRADTRLSLQFHSIDCQAMEDNFVASTAIRFIQGAPQLKFMTIFSNDDPCIGGGMLRSLVHFTGRDQLSDRTCSNDVIFGAVDRVDFLALGSEQKVETAVAVTAEAALFFSNCKDVLLGTFKLNRSSFDGFLVALSTGMRAGAQVDVNFNSFDSVDRAIRISNSNQSTTITNNIFNLNNITGRGTSGVLLETNLVNPPARTRLVIHNNQFNIVGNATFAFGIGTILRGGGQNVSLIVTDNDFNSAGASIVPILGTDTDKAVVSNNHFSGQGLRAIDVKTQFSSGVSGWSITGNTGLGSYVTGEADIIFGPNASQNVVGPGQGSSVIDNGTGNFIL